MVKSGDKYVDKWITNLISKYLLTFWQFYMFIGEYQHNLDNKGRIQVPAKLRVQLGKGAVVTRGLDSCLFLYPKAAWRSLASKLSKLPISKASARAFGRLMLAGAMAVDIDKQGRMLIPDYLRRYAGLKKMVIVAGLYSRLEIWDKVLWEKYKKGTEKAGSVIAEELSDIGV